jgi:hypothetical protein
MYPRGYIFMWLLKTPFSIWIQGRDSRKGLGFNEGRKKRRKEGVQGRKEQKGKTCVCMHVHQARPHHKFTPGSTISTWRRGIKKGKGRAGKGREWKGRAGKGREGKSRGATYYNHPLPRCTLSPSQSGPLPVPVSILPLGKLPPSQIIGPPTKRNDVIRHVVELHVSSEKKNLGWNKASTT